MFSLYHFQRGLQTRTLGSRGYFFLIDTDGSRRSRVNEAQSAEEKKEKKILWNPGYQTRCYDLQKINEVKSCLVQLITILIVIKQFQNALVLYLTKLIISMRERQSEPRRSPGQNPSFALLVSRPYPFSICIIQRDGVHYNVSLATRSSFIQFTC